MYGERQGQSKIEGDGDRARERGRVRDWGCCWGFVSGSRKGNGNGTTTGTGSPASSAALPVSWPSQLLFWLNKLRTCRGDDGSDIKLQRIE